LLKKGEKKLAQKGDQKKESCPTKNLMVSQEKIWGGKKARISTTKMKSFG